MSDQEKLQEKTIQKLNCQENKNDKKLRKETKIPKPYKTK